MEIGPLLVKYKKPFSSSMQRLFRTSFLPLKSFRSGVGVRVGKSSFISPLRSVTK